MKREKKNMSQALGPQSLYSYRSVYEAVEADEKNRQRTPRSG